MTTQRRPKPKLKAPAEAGGAFGPLLRRALGLVLALAVVLACVWYWKQYMRPGPAHNRAGMDALAAQRPADAEQEWLLGTKEDPASPECYVQLGDLHMAQRRYAQAAVRTRRPNFRPTTAICSAN